MYNHVQMNRRQFLGVAGGVLTAAMAGWPILRSAAAVPDSDLLKVLDNALWIPDGKTSARHIYVLAAPWCGYCQAFYQQTRQRLAGVQLRWIETAGRDAASTPFEVAAGLSRDPIFLAQMYGTPRQPPPALRDTSLKSNVQRYNFGIELTISRARFREGEVSFPTLVLKTGTDTAILKGLLQDLPSVFARVTPRPEAADIEPNGPGLVARPFQSQPIARRRYFTNRDDMPVFALPSEAAPIVALYARNRGLQGIATVESNGTKWIELEVFNGPGTWTGFAKEMDLQT
jgi:hypothetical protein